jgi:hypothetical protein
MKQPQLPASGLLVLQSRVRQELRRPPESDALGLFPKFSTTVENAVEKPKSINGG